MQLWPFSEAQSSYLNAWDLTEDSTILVMPAFSIGIG